jgi:ABC-2 type transport system ATP-binding protein
VTNEVAIDVRGLRKSYGAFEAVRGIDLRISRGEIFALLGPNGAGKTVTVEILEGHRQRTQGEVSVLGYDPQRLERDFKRRIGVVLQEKGVQPYLTVAETVELYRGYYEKPLGLDQLIDLVGLQEQRGVRVMRLSGGQQRRLDVAVGLAGDPELLFLDEPTTGFDPAARRGAWEMIKGLQALGKTIFLTTHYMEEAEYLADRVAIIKAGEIVAQGPPRQLVPDENKAIIRFTVPAGVEDLLSGIEGVSSENGRVTLETSAPTATLHQITGRAREHNLELADLTVSRLTLEDVYLRLVGDTTEVAE